MAAGAAVVGEDRRAVGLGAPATAAPGGCGSAAGRLLLIVDPNADVTKGYKPNIMPQDFGTKLSKEELDALVKYLLESQE